MVTSVPNKVGNYSSTGNGVHKLFFGDITNFLTRCLFRALSVGPIPTHLTFIMDGNRRYAKKKKQKGESHKAGYLALVSLLRYCYELGIKYVNIYAFSIDNFKRRPNEVQSLMDLMLEKMEALLMEESIVNQYGIRVCFIGNLRLLSEPVRAAAERVMKVTSNNRKAMLLVCVAYTASDEIVHAVEGSCKEKGKEFRLCNLNNDVMDDVKEGEKINGMVVRNIQDFYEDTSVESQGLKQGKGCNGVTYHACESFESNCDQVLTSKASKSGEFSEGCRNLRQEDTVIKLVDIEKHVYIAVAPDPDMLIRSSGESRLSNFLLWLLQHCGLRWVCHN